MPLSCALFIRLSEEQSLEMLESMNNSRCTLTPSVVSLLEKLNYHPMALALAGATMKLYHSLLPQSEFQGIISSYYEVLLNSLEEHSDVDILDVAVDLYLEAAVSNICLQHVFDFLGSCNLEHPLPLSVFPIHLGWTIYDIPGEALAPPPLEPLLDKMKPALDNSYFSYLKSVVPFLHPKVPSDEDINSVLAASRDQVSFLRESPILSFKHCCHGDFECVVVHSAASRKLPQLFTQYTLPKLDHSHITKKELEFEQNSWFKQYRTFNKKKCLETFHRTLPGVSSRGIKTEKQFDAAVPCTVQGLVSGTSIPEVINYPQYLHIVSHYHRVVSSLDSTVRTSKGEMGGVLLKRYFLPHLQAIRQFPLLSLTDKLTTDIAMIMIEAVSSSSEECKNIISEYEKLVAQQETIFGSKNQLVARSLVDMADLKLSLDDAVGAKKLLDSAVRVYEQVPPRLASKEFALDVGHAFSSMGMACSEMGDKEQSRMFYERALASYQTVPSSGEVTEKQRKLVGSALVDMTHIYLSLGDFVVAKKYSELAVMMLQTLYPQGHMESVRLFNISSIISALLGDKSESVRFRTEASKIKTKINSKKLCKS